MGNLVELINDGDIVSVYWNGDSERLENIKVLHRAMQTGDLWYFEGTDGSIIAQNPNSSNFDCIIKEKSHGNNS
jgi:hypothetical protein